MIFSKQLKATIMAALFTGTSLVTMGITSATSNTVVHSAKRVQTEHKTKPSKVITSTKSTHKTHTNTPVASRKGQQESNSISSKSVVRYSQEPTVRVLLGSRTETLPVSLSSGAKVVGGKTSFSATGDLKVTVSGNTVKVNGKAVGPTAHIKPIGVGGAFTALGQSYHGGLKVIARNGGMRLINEVGLEDYVAGVLPYEMSPSWPQAALQAQAVAARTYALNNMAKAKGQDYDVTPSTDYQVYKGKERETQATRKAVQHTQGMVMTYGGQPINALFHSDGGGYTESAVNVWGNDLPYLKGVKDYSTHEGTRSWLITTSRHDLEAKLRAAGKSVGSLKKIELTPMGRAPLETRDRGISGRVKQATFVGASKKVTLTGDQLRSILGLKSTLFDFYVNHKPSVQEKPGRSYHTFTRKNDVVYILGHGWGHGLGLSQWGAYEMAQKGPNNGEYYKKILNHYYTGIQIDKWY